MSEIHPPILRRLVVDGTPERAFAAFVDDIYIWWPKAFSANGEKLARVTIELASGGRIFETGPDGSEMPWGSVIAFERGRRLVLEWRLGLPEGQGSEVELAFLPVDGGTEIGFVHRGWSDDNADQRAKFDHAEGWDRILRAYIEYVHRRGGTESS